MNYQIALNNGQVFTATAEQFNAAEFTNTLNNREVIFVNFGGAILNKNMILAITPSPEQTA